MKTPFLIGRHSPSQGQQGTTTESGQLTRRGFLRKSGGATLALIAASHVPEKVNAAEEGNGSSYYALECTADADDNQQKITQQSHKFSRSIASAESTQYRYINARTRLRIRISGEAQGPYAAGSLGGPSYSPINEKARRFVFTPLSATILVAVERVSNETWDSANKQWITISPSAGGNIWMSSQGNNLDLSPAQVKAWREIDTDTGTLTKKDGQLRKKSFSSIFKMNYTDSSSDRMNSVNISIDCSCVVGAKPNLIVMGLSDLLVKRNAITSINVTAGINVVGVGWGYTTLDSEPLIENLKFRWQSRTCRTNTRKTNVSIG